MSLNKKTRKNLIIASVTAVLVVGFALGLWFFVQYQSDQKTVEVQPVSYLSTSYWGDTTYSSGTAASDSTQEIYPSTEQTISDIYVTEGQQVSVGDPLLQYDNTKLELDVEAKDIAVKQAEIELDDAEDEAELPGLHGSLGVTRAMARSSRTRQRGEWEAVAAAAASGGDGGVLPGRERENQGRRGNRRE